MAWDVGYIHWLVHSRLWLMHSTRLEWNACLLSPHFFSKAIPRSRVGRWAPGNNPSLGWIFPRHFLFSRLGLPLGVHLGRRGIHMVWCHVPERCQVVLLKLKQCCTAFPPLSTDEKKGLFHQARVWNINVPGTQQAFQQDQTLLPPEAHAFSQNGNQQKTQVGNSGFYFIEIFQE